MINPFVLFLFNAGLRYGLDLGAVQRSRSKTIGLNDIYVYAVFRIVSKNMLLAGLKLTELNIKLSYNVFAGNVW